MAKEKKKGVKGRGGTPDSTSEKPVKSEAVKAKTTARKTTPPKAAKPVKARRKSAPKKKPTAKVQAGRAVTTVCPTPAPAPTPTEPFNSKGPPPEGGRRTEITRGQALFLLRVPGSEVVIGMAQHFLVLEWRGLLPAGFPVNDDFLGDLDEEEDIARNEGGEEIARYRLLDVPWDNAGDDDDAPPGFMALVWY